MARFKPTRDISDDDISSLRNTMPNSPGAENLVIDEIGEDAATYAAERADLLHREGDALGAATWRRIAPVIGGAPAETAEGGGDELSVGAPLDSRVTHY